jgi:hypothetical protein
MLVSKTCEFTYDPIQSLLPGTFHEVAVLAKERCPQPVGAADIGRTVEMSLTAGSPRVVLLIATRGDGKDVFSLRVEDEVASTAAVGTTRFHRSALEGAGLAADTVPQRPRRANIEAKTAGDTAGIE